MYLPYNPAIPLLHICPKKATILKDTCAPMSTAARFTIAETRKQPRCPSTGEWVKMWCSYTMKYYSAIRRNRRASFRVRWVNLQPLTHSEVSQKERQVPYGSTYMWNLERLTDEPCREHTCWHSRRWGAMNWVTLIYTLSCKIVRGALVYSAGSPAWHAVMT